MVHSPHIRCGEGAMWPKIIYVKGIGFPVESWEDFDEIVRRYGREHLTTGEESHAPERKPTGRSSSRLGHRDHVLLQQFIERGNQGILNNNLGPLLGAARKGISPSLRGWARKIDLAHADQIAFERFNSAVGRGYRLLDGFVPIARSLLGMS